MPITDVDIIQAARSLGMIGGNELSAHRILAALCDTSLNARQIADIIQRDPGLAARVLKIANSAYYGSPRQIATLDRALLLLGLDAVRTVAAAACLDRGTPRRNHKAPIDSRALTLHCVASACAAESLATKSGRTAPAEAFMAALLHDFGIPVQERLDPPGLVRLIEALAADAEAAPTELEASLVQVGHAHCAQVIFGDWRLPETIVAAVCHHDAPTHAAPPMRSLALVTNLGVQVALLAGFVHPLEPRPGRSARELLLRSLGLEEQVLQELVEGLAARVHQVVGAP